MRKPSTVKLTLRRGAQSARVCRVGCTLPWVADPDPEMIKALFASDLAKDVRAEFDERRRYGLTVADATRAVIASFHHLLDEPAEGPIVIIALAGLQLRDEALDATMQEAALELLREGSGFEARAGEATAFRRDRQLLREQLIKMLAAARVVSPDEFSA
jgi:hypothetical protein